MDYERAIGDLPMAVHEQLWNEQQLAEPVQLPAWRLWRYAQPVVVLGCSQRRLLSGADELVGMPVLVRASGGGAVLTGPWMLGLSVALPPDHPLATSGPVGSYRWLGEDLAQVLRGAGLVGAHAVSPESLRATGPPQRPQGVDWACFGGLSPWEVLTADGRKLVGLAQVRKRTGVLLVGGVLLEASPWALLCRTLARGSGDAQQLAQLTSSCREELDASFDAQALERSVAEALRRRLERQNCTQ
ncbi:lipoate-protein ligase A [Simplicispira sp. 125]|nr:lipoate-protein ligase A [Simplicispira sp. 125]REG18010.1 lipoate-protein ligase A [Simplicispira sp. 110]